MSLLFSFYASNTVAFLLLLLFLTFYTCLALDVNVCFASFGIFLSAIFGSLGFCLRIFFKVITIQVDGHLFYFSFLPLCSPLPL